MIPEALLVVVVSMVDCREARRRLGFCYERCVRSRVPPCRLKLPGEMQSALLTFFDRRHRYLNFTVYDKGAQLRISLLKAPLVVTLYVKTNVTLTEKDYSMHWTCSPGAVARTYRFCLMSNTCTATERLVGPCYTVDRMDCVSRAVFLVK